MNYDSTAETLNHIRRVNKLLIIAAKELMNRAMCHDSSKLRDPEKAGFDEYTPKLKETTYGSEEYKKFLSELNKTLEHHYAENRHHPNHYPNGINDFDLFDLVEMFFDWKAASERHEDGNIYESLRINKERFGVSDQLIQILKNTADRCFGLTN